MCCQSKVRDDEPPNLKQYDVEDHEEAQCFELLSARTAGKIDMKHRGIAYHDIEQTQPPSGTRFSQTSLS